MASNFQETAVKTVQVDRGRLATTLRENLSTHRREFLEARTGYDAKRLELIRTLAEHALHASKLGNQTDEARKAVHESYSEFRDLEKPQDHSNEYEQAIKLMEWETRDTVELSINDFESYVRDNWNWKNSFKLAHSNYTTPNS
jgi:hypothetical protein